MPYFKAALSFRVSQAIADRSICLIDPFVEDQFAFPVVFRVFFRSKRNAVRIPEASNRKLKAPHRREREQAPHLQTPGANSAENGSAATATTSHNQRG